LLLEALRKALTMAGMLAHAALALYVVVRVYDMHGVPADTAATARATAERILNTASVTVRWAACPCGKPAGPVELMIRLADATPASEPDSLGFSYVDLDRQAGTLATVFADRVRALADAARVDEGELLGRAMAHEIGHLIIGTRDHASAGLMRGRWTSIELAQNHPVDWQFRPTDGEAFRRALVRRIRGARTPAALMAGVPWAGAAVSAP
jgi:hypothetical protein